MEASKEQLLPIFSNSFYWIIRAEDRISMNETFSPNCNFRFEFIILFHVQCNNVMRFFYTLEACPACNFLFCLIQRILVEKLN